MRLLLILLVLLGLGVVMFVAFDPGGRSAEPAAIERPAGRRGAAAPQPADLTPPATDRPSPGTARPGGRVSARPEGEPAARRASRGMRRVTGMVLAEGKPLQGTEIVILSERETVARSESDGRGRFELAFPVPAHDVVLRAVAAGYAPFARELGTHPSPGEIGIGNLRLVRGRALTGLVVAPGGAPVAAAEVRLVVRGSDQAPLPSDVRRTDATGRFAFDAVPRSVRLLTRAPGFGEVSLPLLQDQTEVTVTLKPSLTLRLALRDPAGEPVPGARVSIRSSDPGASQRNGTSDDQGDCVFAGLGVDTWSVLVACPGYRPTGLPGVLANDVPVPIEVVPWPCITGRVLAPGEESVPAGTTVSVLPAAARGDLVGIAGTGTAVAANGEFRACDLRPGTYVLLFQAPGFAPTRSQPVFVSHETVSSAGTIELERGGSLVLRLRRDGEPLPGVRAEVLRVPPQPAQIWLELGPPQARSASVSDASGTLTLDALAGGQIWVVLRAVGTVPESQGPFLISNDRANEPRPIVLHAGQAIRGRVLDATGAPIGNARLRMNGASVAVPFLEADEQGNFTTPPVPVGRYSLVATRFTGSQRATSPQTWVEVEADTEARVEVRFVD